MTTRIKLGNKMVSIQTETENYGAKALRCIEDYREGQFCYTEHGLGVVVEVLPFETTIRVYVTKLDYTFDFDVDELD